MSIKFNQKFQYFDKKLGGGGGPDSDDVIMEIKGEGGFALMTNMMTRMGGGGRGVKMPKI